MQQIQWRTLPSARHGYTYRRLGWVGHAILQHMQQIQWRPLPSAQHGSTYRRLGWVGSNIYHSTFLLDRRLEWESKTQDEVKVNNGGGDYSVNKSWAISWQLNFRHCIQVLQQGDFSKDSHNGRQGPLSIYLPAISIMITNEMNKNMWFLKSWS